MGKQRTRHKQCQRYGCTRLAGKAGYCREHDLSDRKKKGEGDNYFHVEPGREVEIKLYLKRTYENF